MAEESRHEGTHPSLPRYFVVNAGDSGSREKGEQYLAKLESTKMERINIDENPTSRSTEMYMKTKALLF